jgi:hypothetical protein
LCCKVKHGEWFKPYLLHAQLIQLLSDLSFFQEIITLFQLDPAFVFLLFFPHTHVYYPRSLSIDFDIFDENRARSPFPHGRRYELPMNSIIHRLDRRQLHPQNVLNA